MFYDLRAEQSNPIPRSKVYRGKTDTLHKNLVNGICLHQTGIEYGINERQLRESDGDYHLAKARRFLNVPAHAVVGIDGIWCVHSPIDAYLHHAGPLNRYTLGLEIEGLYSGTDDGHRLSSLTLDAAKEALAYLVTEGRNCGMDIKYIYAHRQSAASRRADPGYAIWQQVALDLGPCFGLVPRNHIVLGDGRKIPKDWDPNDGLGKY